MTALTMARNAWRTMVTPWLVLVQVALLVATTVNRGTAWRGELFWTVDWHAIVLVTLAPLVVAAMAVDSARIGQPGRMHLVQLAVRGRSPYLWCLLAGLLPLLIMQTLGALIAVAWSAVGLHSATEAPSALGALLVQLAALAFYAAVGLLVGRWLAPVAAGIVGVVVGFAMLFAQASTTGGRFVLLDLGGSLNSRIGLSLSAGYFWWQGGLLLVLGGACVTLATVTSHHGAAPRLGAVLGATVMVMSMVAVPGLPSERLVPNQAVASSCAGSAPRVCLYSEHERLRPAVSALAETLAAGARAQGYGALMTQVVSEEPATARSAVREPAGTMGFSFDDAALRGGELSAVFFTQDLLSPATCPQLSSDLGPPEGYWQALGDVTNTWLSVAGLPGAPSPSVVVSPQQVQHVLDAWAQCDLQES